MTAPLEAWDERLRSLFGLSLLTHPARLRDGLRAACKELILADDAELLARVDRGDRRAKNALARALTVGETYFFREVQHFDLLRQALIPAAVARRRLPIVLVSAGCASGEEAYSLAVAARQVLGAGADGKVRVLGFDVNERATKAARRGVYRPWSLRGVSEDIKSRWFVRTANEWKVSAEARSLTHFERRNLVDPSDALPTSSADVIFCRNVLIYLADDVVPLVLARLSEALRPGGTLIVSSAEAAFFTAAGLRAYQVGDVWVHTRGEKPSGAVRRGRAPEGTKQRKVPPITRVLEQASRVVAASRASLRAVRGAPELTASPPRAGHADDAVQCIEHGWSMLAADPVCAGADARRAILLDRTLVGAHVLAASAALAQSNVGAARRALRHARRYLAAAPRPELVRGGGGTTAAEMESYCARIERTLGAPKR